MGVAALLLMGDVGAFAALLVNRQDAKCAKGFLVFPDRGGLSGKGNALGVR